MRLIDADEILKSEHQHYDYWSDEHYVHVRDIENAPTVDAEPIKHGRWINGQCSECGCDRTLRKVYRGGEVVWAAPYKDNYCSSCGAKMENSKQ